MQALREKRHPKTRERRMLRELLALDEAVATAVRFAGEDSLILVVGKQSIGGLRLNGYPFRSDKGVAVVGTMSRHSFLTLGGLYLVTMDGSAPSRSARRRRTGSPRVTRRRAKPTARCWRTRSGCRSSGCCWTVLFCNVTAGIGILSRRRRCPGRSPGSSATPARGSRCPR